MRRRASRWVEAGGGLHKVRSGAFGGLACAHNLVVGQGCRLDDDLDQNRRWGRVTNSLDVRLDELPVAILHGAQVDDHVDLVRAVGHSSCGLGGLDCGLVSTRWEAHNGRYLEVRPLRKSNGKVGRGNADRERA